MGILGTEPEIQKSVHTILIHTPDTTSVLGTYDQVSQRRRGEKIVLPLLSRGKRHGTSLRMASGMLSPICFPPTKGIVELTVRLITHFSQTGRRATGASRPFFFPHPLVQAALGE